MRNTFRKLAAAAVPLIVMVAALGATAQAQWADRDDYRRYGDYRNGRYDVRQIAYENGYREGLKDGREHGRNGKRYDPWGRGDFKDGDEGYRREYGSKDDYKRFFREGFLRGYDVGYRGSGNDGYDRGRGQRGYRDYDDGHGRGWGGRGYDVARIAGENGYRDGLRHGQEDRARRRGYNYDHGEYRDALRGYRSEYGDRETYRRAYRDGYRRGYDEGSRRGNGRSQRPFRWPF